MIEFKDEYIDSSRNKYNIRNINVSQLSELKELGKFVTETIREVDEFLSESDNLENGVYIYKSNYNPKKALRIYKDFASYKYIYHSDAKEVSKLQEIQDKIKLTEFPTGIITIGDSVIGQEIPFYENYKTLHEIIKQLKDVKTIFYYYSKIIDILDELAKQSIIYKDIHAKNFMIKDKSVKLIDFEGNSFMFGDDIKYLIPNLRFMINYINETLKINFKVNSETLNGLKEEILVKSKKIV